MPRKPKDYIDILRKIVESKGGKLISKKYTDNRTPLKVKCEFGHYFYPTSDSLERLGTWCRTCSFKKSGQYKKLSIEYLKDFAKSKNGECLSNEYKRLENIYEWRCSEGHIWTAKGNNVTINNTWCPYCLGHRNEEYCRVIFEEIFNKTFKKCRPDWLRNKYGNKMELDGYCEEVNIAFEYHGEQHFKEHYFNKDRLKHNLDDRKEHDLLKYELCKKNNVLLIVITYLDDIEKLPSLIKNKIDKAKIKELDLNFNINIDYKNLVFNKSYLLEMQELAKARNGLCLSNNYINARSHLNWKCLVCNHIWSATPDKVKNRNQWCPECGKKKQIQALKNFIKNKKLKNK